MHSYACTIFNALVHITQSLGDFFYHSFLANFDKHEIYIQKHNVQTAIIHVIVATQNFEYF